MRGNAGKHPIGSKLTQATDDVPTRAQNIGILNILLAIPMDLPMAELLPEIRNAARALIVQDGRVLLLKKTGGGRGERFALPGGAQDPGETLKAALDRECREEIGTSVEIGDLIHVADFFKLRDTQPPTRRHLVEFVFSCSLPEGYAPRNGPKPDKHQLDVVWVDLSTLARISIFPGYLATCIAQHADPGQKHYLGAFHDDAASQEH